MSRSNIYYRPRAASAEDLYLMGEIDRKYPGDPLLWVGTDEGLGWNGVGFGVSRKRVQRLTRHGTCGPSTGVPAPANRCRSIGSIPTCCGMPGSPGPTRACPRVGGGVGRDITYLPMARGFLYLVAIMDWHSRYVVYWRLSNTLEASFCAEALEEALGQRQSEVFNTDQSLPCEGRG